MSTPQCLKFESIKTNFNLRLCENRVESSRKDDFVIFNSQEIKGRK